MHPSYEQLGHTMALTCDNVRDYYETVLDSVIRHL